MDEILQELKKQNAKIDVTNKILVQIYEIIKKQADKK